MATKNKKVVKNNVKKPVSKKKVVKPVAKPKAKTYVKPAKVSVTVAPAIPTKVETKKSFWTKVKEFFTF